MATKSIGVRELKLHAPALVKRAARGERILITRYGQPSAQLGPPESEPAGEETGRMAAWRAERRAFDALLPRLTQRYRGRYVAVHGGRVVGANADPDALFEHMWRKLRGQTFFIGRVGGPPAVVDMPGFDIE